MAWHIHTWAQHAIFNVVFDVRVFNLSLPNVFNSATFVDEIKNIHLDDNDMFVSFDVISLFTNVPVDETCA